MMTNGVTEGAPPVGAAALHGAKGMNGAVEGAPADEAAWSLGRALAVAERLQKGLAEVIFGQDEVVRGAW